MHLALRSDPPVNATHWQGFVCGVIKARLVSQWSHGGVVIRGDLYHATAHDGLNVVKAGNWTPERWDLFNLPDFLDPQAYRLFIQYQGAKYDWKSLLAFVGVKEEDNARFYCFEWCYLAITGQLPQGRVTPEVLLSLTMRIDPIKQSLHEAPIT
jgi:hypothetical protein